MQFDNLFEATISSRPSKMCKSPYMADIIISDQEYLAHAPSLGCSGLTDKECKVLVSPITSKNTKSSHRIQFSIVNETWENRDYEHIVCTNPQIAENIVQRALQNNLLHNLKAKSFKGQVSFESSRFDFAGIDENDIEFIAEVKTVPVADYHNVDKKAKKKMMKENTFINKHPKDKVAIFPDGYIKPSKEPKPQSERANKHILELTHIKQHSNKRCIMIYVIQRCDASSFVISDLDLIYKQNVNIAKQNGVELYFIQMEWKKINGSVLGNIIKEVII